MNELAKEMRDNTDFYAAVERGYADIEAGSVARFCSKGEGTDRSNPYADYLVFVKADTP